MNGAKQPDEAGSGSNEAFATAQARIAELEREVARLRITEGLSRKREQQISQHNLVLMNLSRSAAIERGDLAAAFEEITLAAAHTLNVERASIWLFTPDRSAIKCVDLYQRSEDRHGNDVELKASEFPAYFRAVEDNRTLAAEDARTDPRTSEFDRVYLTPLGITSMLDAPVRRGGRLIGVICHEQVGEPRTWSLEDQAFAGSMADFVAMTMQAHERNEALKAVAASERQLRQIIDLVPHMILVKDARGRILLCNKAVADAYGTTVERFLGSIQWDVHPNLDEAAAMLSDDLRVIEIGQELLVAEERFTDTAGRTRTHQTTKIPCMFSALREPAVLAVSIDITQRKQDEAARELMIQELDHRVKNILAVVLSIAEQTSRGSPTVESFIADFAGRLRALAITHEMLAGGKWEGADLRAMIERLVMPHATSAGVSRVTIDGSPQRLPATIAPSVCMVLHELVTNAAKHGALSIPNGRVTMSWQCEMHVDGDRRIPWLHIEWIECGGPAAHAPVKKGFGTSFIEQTVSYQLRGQSKLDFTPAGLIVRLDVPLERPLRSNMGGSAEAVATSQLAESTLRNAREFDVDNGQAAATCRRVLVVEDDHLVAQSLVSQLRSLGCEIVGPAATSDDACALVKSQSVDAAILDLNLSSGTSAPVARALAGRRTPFVFVTGYSSLKSLPDDLRGQRVLCKPVDRESLGRALNEMATT